MKPTKFNSELVGEGVSVQEMVKLLQLYNEVQDYKVIRDKVFKENYLGKNSDSRIENILRAFRKRFLNNSQLPPPELLGEIMKSDVLSDFGKQQLLLPYYLYSDNLLRTAYYELVVKSIRLEKSLSLNHSDVLDFLKNIGKKHSNIRKWSKNLKSKWATRFLTFLRTFDMLENYPKNKLKKTYVLPTTFAFFTLWFTSNRQSFRRILSHDIWEFYLLKKEEVLELVNTTSKKGWWVVEITGDIVSFQPKYTLKEWLMYGLD
ncbi:hypothetical protein DRP05_11120 [Archaeoglobales archaeon]|nr:MAG: hypothetical protein DRP05_11120 [Archaeoglobales archaeon]